MSQDLEKRAAETVVNMAEIANGFARKDGRDHSKVLSAVIVGVGKGVGKAELTISPGWIDILIAFLELLIMILKRLKVKPDDGDGDDNDDGDSNR